MSETRTVEGRGEFVEMGKCSDCGKDWGMYQSEVDFFEKLVKEQNYKMPKRCPSCRGQKRKMRDGVETTISLRILIDRIHKMANQAKEGVYSLHEEVLYDELLAVADALKTFARQNKQFDKLKVQSEVQES